MHHATNRLNDGLKEDEMLGMFLCTIYTTINYAGTMWFIAIVTNCDSWWLCKLSTTRVIYTHLLTGVYAIYATCSTFDLPTYHVFNHNPSSQVDIPPFTYCLLLCFSSVGTQ